MQLRNIQPRLVALVEDGSRSTFRSVFSSTNKSQAAHPVSPRRRHCEETNRHFFGQLGGRTVETLDPSVEASLDVSTGRSAVGSDAFNCRKSKSAGQFHTSVYHSATLTPRTWRQSSLDVSWSMYTSLLLLFVVTSFPIYPFTLPTWNNQRPVDKMR